MTTKLKPTYEIANYLPLPLRRKMANRAYDQTTSEGAPICKTGRCPLGWLFADPPKGKPTKHQLRPSGVMIARRIRRLFPTRVKDVFSYDLIAYAEDFTTDWDYGRINDLHKALGVPK